MFGKIFFDANNRTLDNINLEYQKEDGIITIMIHWDVRYDFRRLIHLRIRK